MNDAPAPATQGYDWAADPILFLLLLTLTPVTTLMGLLTASPIILGAFNALVVFPYLALAIRKSRVGRACLFVSMWAIVVSISALVAGSRLPQRAEVTMPEAVEQRAQLVGWITSGQRPQAEPENALREGAIMALASLPTAGLAGLYLEARTLNQTAIAIGPLAVASNYPPLAAIVLWTPWDVAHHAAQWLLVVLLAEPLLRLSLAPVAQRWRLWLAAAAIWLLSILLGEVLSPLWLTLIRTTTGI